MAKESSDGPYRKLAPKQCRCLGAGCWMCSHERDYQAKELLRERLALEGEIRRLESALKNARRRLGFLQELRQARDLARV